MSQQLDYAKKRLFDADAMAVSNIKLFPGSSRDTTSEQFSDQINKSISLIEAGDFDEVEFED